MIRDGDDLKRSTPGHRDAVSVVVRHGFGALLGLRRRRPGEHRHPGTARGDADQQQGRRPFHQTMQVHGSRCSFGQYYDCGRDQGGRGPARCIADRRRHRRLLGLTYRKGQVTSNAGPIGAASSDSGQRICIASFAIVIRLAWERAPPFAA